MHQFGWLSERGGNFLDLLQKERGTQKGGGVPQKRGGGVPTLEETVGDMEKHVYIVIHDVVSRVMFCQEYHRFKQLDE